MANDKSKIRNILAIIIVVVMLLTLVFILIYPYIMDLSGRNGVNDTTFKVFDKATALFTGIIGVIIGFYFGGGQKS